MDAHCLLLNFHVSERRHVEVDPHRFLSGWCLKDDMHRSIAYLSIHRFIILIPFMRQIGIHCVSTYFALQSRRQHRYPYPKFHSGNLFPFVCPNFFPIRVFSLIMVIDWQKLTGFSRKISLSIRFVCIIMLYIVYRKLIAMASICNNFTIYLSISSIAENFNFIQVWFTPQMANGYLCSIIFLTTKFSWDNLINIKLIEIWYG